MYDLSIQIQKAMGMHYLYLIILKSYSLEGKIIYLFTNRLKTIYKIFTYYLVNKQSLNVIQ